MSDFDNQTGTQSIEAAWATTFRFLSDEILSKSVSPGLYFDLLIDAIHGAERPNASIIKIHTLPLLTNLVCGGALNQAVPLMAAWFFLRCAAKQFDDIEDNSENSSPELTNLATGLLFAAHQSLTYLWDENIPGDRIRLLWSEFNRSSLKACEGQHEGFLNTISSPSDPECWERIALAKSGRLYAWAAWSGACITGQSEQESSKFYEYGLALGVLIQIADDFRDLWSPSQKSDLCARQISLPVCYSLYVAEETQRKQLLKFIELAIQGDHWAEEQARDLVTSLGAQKFIIAAAWLQVQKAKKALVDINAGRAEKQPLFELLDQTFPFISEERQLF